MHTGSDALGSYVDATTLDAPNNTNLTALNKSRGGGTVAARGFRALVSGTVSFKTARGNDEVWDVLAGEGYDLQVTLITFPAGKIRIFF